MTANPTAYVLARAGVGGVPQPSFALPLSTSMVPSTALGSATPTYSRATAATVDDWENVVRTTLSGEMRFQGMRRVRNLITGSSIDITNVQWGASLAGGTGVTPVRTANFALAPDGTMTASRLQIDRGAGNTAADLSAAVNAIAVTGGVNEVVVDSVWMRTNDGANKIICIRNIGTQTVTVTPDWQRFCVTEVTTTPTQFQIITRGTYGTDQAADLLVWGCQCEYATGQSNINPSEYVSVGVLSSPYHGAGVDGVKYFATQNRNSVPQNLIIRSQTFDSASWAKRTFATVTANTTTAPDGTLTADTLTEAGGDSSNEGTFNEAATTTGTYVISVYAKAGTISVMKLILKNRGTDAIISSTVFGLSTNWQRFEVTGVVTGGVRMEITTNAQVGSIVIWGAQVQFNTTYSGTYVPTTTVAISTNAITDGTGTTLTGLMGYLSENNRTNLFLRSDTFGTTWVPTNASVTTDAAVAPDGYTTADKLVEDATAATTHSIAQGSITLTATNATVSVWAKASGRSVIILQFPSTFFVDVTARNVWFDLSGATVSKTSGTGATGTIKAYPNGWYRCTATAPVDVATTSAPGIYLDNNPTGTGTYNGDGTSGVFLWGAQVEQASFPGTYIPTTTVAVTRNTDIYSFAAAGNMLSTQGSVYFEAFIPYLTGNYAPAVVFDLGGAIIESIDFAVVADVSNNTGRLTVRSGGVAQADITTTGTITPGVMYKFAGRWRQDDFVLTRTTGFGVPTGTDVSGNLPTQADKIEINTRLGVSGGMVLMDVRIWNVPLPTATLQAMVV